MIFYKNINSANFIKLNYFFNLLVTIFSAKSKESAIALPVFGAAWKPLKLNEVVGK